MTVLDDQGRPEPPLAAGESDTLVGFLEYQRATFGWKSSGLDAAGLQATVAVSNMTLGGMLKHLAYYEDHWFSHRMCGNRRDARWNADDWDADPDWEWNSAATDSPEDLRRWWEAAVSRSRELLAGALASGGLDRPARRGLPDGRTPSVRWIVVHMIEEYARHNGHADLIRESIDGLVGE
ncbi:MAG TPA: DinB family protein [Mycobacteriales bacterium]|nr:DinB family protein [Mycobacteriales bacterium]